MFIYSLTCYFQYLCVGPKILNYPLAQYHKGNYLSLDGVCSFSKLIIQKRFGSFIRYIIKSAIS